MFIAIWALNNITAHNLLTVHHRVPLDSYRNQTINDFKKPLNQKGVKNTMMITGPIFLIFCMHIGPTRLLEDSASNAKFDADGRLRLGSTNLDWDDSAKIMEAIAGDKDNEDEKKDHQEKNKGLKRQK